MQVRSPEMMPPGHHRLGSSHCTATCGSAGEREDSSFAAQYVRFRHATARS
jgi:hypothetical protein